MICPNCPNTALVMADRQGVEIDYCPQCRGVWLDRGELDKLMARAVSESQANMPSQPVPQQRSPGHAAGNHRDFDDSDYRSGQQGTAVYGRRKKSWLNEIFD